jgi:hypothetical protein
MMESRSLTVIIEKAVDRVKLGIVPAGKRTKTDKWFRKQWFRTMMRDRKKLGRFSRSRTPDARI